MNSYVGYIVIKKFFPQGLSPDDYIRGTEQSILRNPKIAEMFFYTNNIDRWASGFQRINAECMQFEVNFKFEILSSGLCTTFYRKSQNTRKHTTKKTTLKTTLKNTSKTTEKILAVIEKNPQISIVEISKLLETITLDGVKYNIKKHY